MFFCFIVWHCSPGSFLKNSLLVRCAFWKKFSGASFWCLAFVSGWLFFGVVLPMFLLYCLALFSRKFPEKFSSCQVRILEEIFGSELLVFSLCVRLVFFGVVLPMFFCFIVWCCSPGSFLENSLLVRCVFWKKFSGANFWFLAFVSGWCFLVLFCLCFCFIVWRCPPESFLKNSLLVRCAFWKKFSGASFWCLAFVSGWCFLVLFCLCFCFIVWRCSPESFLKNSLLVRYAFWKKFSGASFWFLAFVSGWCFLVLFCLCFFVLLCGVALPEASWKILFLSGVCFGRNFRERTFGF